jgi:TM2 domain-containing membrane protein YozV
MRRSFATFSLWLLLVTVGALSLGSCQRVAYQFQSSPVPYQVPPTFSETSALVRVLNRHSTAEPLPVLPKQELCVGQKQHALPLRLPRASTHSQLPAVRRHLRRADKAPRYLSASKQLQQEPLPSAPVRWRSRGIALVLALLLGGFGAHLFYLGYHRRAILYLLLSVASIVLLGIAAVLFIATLFSSGTAGLLVASLIALALASVVGVLALIDTIFILTDDLKPKDGEYYPGFFQTRSKP